jgi:hypothetical protein
MPEHILIFGATGKWFPASVGGPHLSPLGLSGIEFSFSALRQGHQLTMLVRNPHKLPREIASNVNVTVIEGTFEDVTKLEQAAGAGAQFFVSFAGPPGMSTGTVRLIYIIYTSSLHTDISIAYHECDEADFSYVDRE